MDSSWSWAFIFSLCIGNTQYLLFGGAGSRVKTWLKTQWIWVWTQKNPRRGALGYHRLILGSGWAWFFFYFPDLRNTQLVREMVPAHEEEHLTTDPKFLGLNPAESYAFLLLLFLFLSFHRRTESSEWLKHACFLWRCSLLIVAQVPHYKIKYKQVGLLCL